MDVIGAPAATTSLFPKAPLAANAHVLCLQPCLDNKQGVGKSKCGSTSSASSPHVNGWLLYPVMTLGFVAECGFEMLIYREVYLHISPEFWWVSAVLEGPMWYAIV